MDAYAAVSDMVKEAEHAESRRIRRQFAGIAKQYKEYRWRPSIHMPRWASRIQLEVVSVRVERLQDISEADAIAEGIEYNPRLDPVGPCKWTYYGKPGTGTNATNSFRTLWESINGAGSWDANPWVWVVEFKRLVNAQ